MKFEALKKANEAVAAERMNFWGCSNPRCPHCGEECDEGRNEWWKLHEEGEHEVTCPHCDEDFSVNTRVSYSFSTDDQDGA
jgi:hypothetical protein